MNLKNQYQKYQYQETPSFRNHIKVMYTYKLLHIKVFITVNAESIISYNGGLSRFTQKYDSAKTVFNSNTNK